MPNRKTLIRCEAEKAWLAAIIDGEGCIGISNLKKKDNEYFYTYLEVTSIDRELLEHCGRITGYEKITQQQRDGRTIFRWQLSGEKAVMVIRAVYKFLIIKQRQAAVVHTLHLINRKHVEGFDADKKALKKLIHSLNARAEIELPDWISTPGDYV